MAERWQERSGAHERLQQDSALFEPGSRQCDPLLQGAHQVDQGWIDDEERGRFQIHEGWPEVDLAASEPAVLQQLVLVAREQPRCRSEWDEFGSSPLSTR